MLFLLGLTWEVQNRANTWTKWPLMVPSNSNDSMIFTGPLLIWEVPFCFCLPCEGREVWGDLGWICVFGLIWDGDTGWLFVFWIWVPEESLNFRFINPTDCSIYWNECSNAQLCRGTLLGDVCVPYLERKAEQECKDSASPHKGLTTTPAFTRLNIIKSHH